MAPQREPDRPYYAHLVTRIGTYAIHPNVTADERIISWSLWRFGRKLRSFNTKKQAREWIKSETRMNDLDTARAAFAQHMAARTSATIETMLSFAQHLDSVEEIAALQAAFDEAVDRGLMVHGQMWELLWPRLRDLCAKSAKFRSADTRVSH